jgi:hypothetical protein
MIPTACPNCGSEANWDWYDGGEALNYEADDLMSCGACGHTVEVERERCCDEHCPECCEGCAQEAC